ncbi:MAG: SMP-30/gluconolactonase/LRE family protein [Bryobacteraceae bacterium]|nr:SMP-30/gluconolactonase/LRE family protein [Bryobacteraceae bacterium]
MPMPVQNFAPGFRLRLPLPFRTLVFAPLLLFPAYAANQGVIEPGAKLELLAEIFGFTEGPAADAEGNVFFTDQPYNRIYRWSVADQLTVFHDNAGRANGLYFGKDGNLYACADLNNELWRIDPSGKITVLVKEYEGKRLNGPNDLWIDPKGGIYFTDPFYRRDYWTHTAMPQDGQHVYYLSPDHKKLTRVATDLEQPNGIIGTPDGKRLYVADIRAGRTYVYDILPDGALSHKRLFASLGSDGMTMDEQENIYLTGKGVTVFNVRGEQIDHIEVPERWTANVTFGGKDRRWLFITASDSLYRIRIRVRGAH